MTRKQAVKHERILKARGVYKPYVSASDGRLYIESYPLTAIITDGGCDPENGPAQNVKITDSSLSRIGQDSTVTTTRVFLGQDLLAVVGQLLLDFHGPAYERDACCLARRQPRSSSAGCLLASQTERTDAHETR